METTSVDLVCIVDDDPIFTFTVKRLMQLAGFCTSFLAFRNGKEAFDSLQSIIKNNEKLPKIILLDINMPEWDGWRFLEEFTKIQAAEKIIIYVVSSSINQEDKERANQINAVSNYIVKPITIDDILKLKHSF